MLRRLTSSHYDEFCYASVEGLRGLVSSLLELLVVARLLAEVEDLVCEVSIRQGESLKECKFRV
jgi:hypothetical protein